MEIRDFLQRTHKWMHSIDEDKTLSITHNFDLRPLRGCMALKTKRTQKAAADFEADITFKNSAFC